MCCNSDIAIPTLFHYFLQQPVPTPVVFMKFLPLVIYNYGTLGPFLPYTYNISTLITMSTCQQGNKGQVLHLLQLHLITLQQLFYMYINEQ